MRAVVELHEESDSIPQLRIVIVKGREDLTIKVVLLLFLPQRDILIFVIFFTDKRQRWRHPTVVARCALSLYVLDSSQAFGLWYELSTFGRLWLWSANITFVCSLFAWRFGDQFDGGLWHRCHCLP